MFNPIEKNIPLQYYVYVFNDQKGIHNGNYLSNKVENLRNISYCFDYVYPANKIRWPGLMFYHHLRRCPNIRPAF